MYWVASLLCVSLCIAGSAVIAARAAVDVDLWNQTTNIALPLCQH